MIFILLIGKLLKLIHKVIIFASYCQIQVKKKLYFNLKFRGLLKQLY